MRLPVRSNRPAVHAGERWRAARGGVDFMAVHMYQRHQPANRTDHQASSSGPGCGFWCRASVSRRTFETRRSNGCRGRHVSGTSRRGQRVDIFIWKMWLVS